MFFEKVEDIPSIALRAQTAVFVVPPEVEIKIKNAIILQPEERSSITIEQVRELIGDLSHKQVDDRFVVVRPADLLTDQAANAFLKKLEEPGDLVHFVLVTDDAKKILPTILSRSAVYFWKNYFTYTDQIECDEKTKNLAKRLMLAKTTELIELAEEIVKTKDGVRERALKILAVTVEMSYKSYYITGKEVFLKKIPKFIAAYEAVSQNGHVKLHLVADLL